MKNQVLKIRTTIRENSDDGKEQGSSTWNPDGNASSIITFGNYSGSTYSGAFRFRGVDIPKNARIFLARLVLRIAYTDSMDFPVLLKVKGIKEPDPKSFNQSTRPSTRTKTVNAIDWDIIKKWNVHEWVQTPNLKLIVEEIVAQKDWRAGNSMAFVIEDDGSPADNTKTCWDSSKGAGYEAQLEIYYMPDEPNQEIIIGSLQGNDRDGEEDYKTNWYPSGYSNNQITMGDDGSKSPQESANDAGLIFSPINIPRGGQIISAKILLTSPGQSNGMPNFMIKGFAQDDAPAFALDGSNRPSTRPKTKAQIQWTLGEGEAGILIGQHWSAEGVYESPELKDIIQEIIDRPGWLSNKLGLVLENYFSGLGNIKYCWDYNQDEGKYSAKLIIAWNQKRTFSSQDADTLAGYKANYPEYIIVHNTATPRDNTRFETIRKSHISFGWDNIGYHFFIAGTLDGDGQIIEGRPQNQIGSHCSANKMNYRSIGIVLCGNFHSTGGNEYPTSAQLTSLQQLLDRIRMERRIPKERVMGHGEVPEAATDCPGDHLLTYVKKYRQTGSLI